MKLQTQERAQNAQNIRMPLDHHECDALDRRIAHLVSCGVLTEDELGILLKKRRDLRKVDYRLARRLFARSLPINELRPDFWDDYRRPMSGVFGAPELECMAGWVFRLLEYVAKLECRYLGKVDIAPPRDDDDI
jgi:hypothetical protein